MSAVTNKIFDQLSNSFPLSFPLAAAVADSKSAILVTDASVKSLLFTLTRENASYADSFSCRARFLTTSMVAVADLVANIALTALFTIGYICSLGSSSYKFYMKKHIAQSAIATTIIPFSFLCMLKPSAAIPGLGIGALGIASVFVKSTIDDFTTAYRDLYDALIHALHESGSDIDQMVLNEIEDRFGPDRIKTPDDFIGAVNAVAPLLRQIVRDEM